MISVSLHPKSIIDKQSNNYSRAKRFNLLAHSNSVEKVEPSKPDNFFTNRVQSYQNLKTYSKHSTARKHENVFSKLTHRNSLDDAKPQLEDRNTINTTSH